MAEILKASSIPPATLFRLAADARVVPAWTEIALPQGEPASVILGQVLGANHSIYDQTGSP
jgi:hypothetical protein